MYTKSALAIQPIYWPKRYSGLRKSAVRKIVIHHATAPGWSGVRLAQYIQDPEGRLMNSNYAIGNDGVLVCVLPEEFRPWTTGTYGLADDADDYSITVEVANSAGGPNWPISETAMQTLIKLIADVAKRYGWGEVTYYGGPTGKNVAEGKKGRLLMHEWYAPTLCPGPYLASKYGYIRDEANKLLKTGTAEAKPEKTWGSYPAGTYRTTTNLDVRDRPSHSGTILKRFPVGSIVTTDAEVREGVSGVWVRLAGQEAYIVAEEQAVFLVPAQVDKKTVTRLYIDLPSWAKKETKDGRILLQVGAFTAEESIEHFDEIFSGLGFKTRRE